MEYPKYCFVQYRNKPNEIKELKSEEDKEILIQEQEQGEIFSRGIMYQSEEELRIKQKIEPEPCTNCGSVYHTNYVYETGDALREKKICFDCNFWLERNKDSGSRRIIVNGVKYVDGGSVNYVKEALIQKKFVGHGGRLFKIQFLESGEIIETNNLWCNGDIPEHFRELMPDNAKFI